MIEEPKTSGSTGFHPPGGEYPSAEPRNGGLERLLEWADAKCRQENWQVAGLTKITLDGQAPDYVIFLLGSDLQILWDGRRPYTIYGYSTHWDGEHPLVVYQAELKQHISYDIIAALDSVPYKDRNYLEVDIQAVPDAAYRRKGIGTAGMYAVKSLAKQLQCTHIALERHAFGGMDEESLKAFYAKCGFKQREGSSTALFHMQQFVPDKPALEDICLRLEGELRNQKKKLQEQDVRILALERQNEALREQNGQLQAKLEGISELVSGT